MSDPSASPLKNFLRSPLYDLIAACSGCTTSVLIQQIAISGRTPSMMTAINNCLAGGSGLGCVIPPPSAFSESEFRDTIDTLWAELMAVDFDSPPFTWIDGPCYQWNQKRLADTCGVGTSREWFTSDPGPVSSCSTSLPFVGWHPSLYVPVPAAGIGIFSPAFPAICGVRYDYNIDWMDILVVRTRILNLPHVCLSVLSGTDAPDPCSAELGGTATFVSCSDRSGAGGAIYIPSPGFDPQSVTIDPSITVSNRAGHSSCYYEKAWLEIAHCDSSIFDPNTGLPRCLCWHNAPVASPDCSCSP